MNASSGFNQVTRQMETSNAYGAARERVNFDLSRRNRISLDMIRKLKSGQYRLYSRKKNTETGKRRNLGTFATIEQARRHEREVQYFKKH
jgi:hypothetical protein